jgi:rhamnulokinase
VPDHVTVAAVDLGASSGRVMSASVGAGRLDLVEVHRFANVPVRVRGTLHWDVLRLYRGMLEGLAATSAGDARLDGIGVDTWAVDYGLLDADGALLGNPVHYRDERTQGVREKVLADLGAARLYATTGIQFLPFNTAFQLVAAHGSAALGAARRLLLLPDLLSHWLCGADVAEVTNASTTQLLDVSRRAWDLDLVRSLGIDASLLPPLVEPGTVLGPVGGEAGDGPRVPAGVPVIAVGSHDTASAVVAVPAAEQSFAYISSGTWSLVGVELRSPVLSAESREAGFTNELGVDGTVRYLRNVMGLWLLQESVRTWRGAGEDADLMRLLDAAEDVPALRSIVDPDRPAFLPPGDMPERIRRECGGTGQPVPASPAEVVRCVLDSLALAYRRAVRDATRLSGRDARVVHLVGGGSQNAMLCQLTADACGLPVVAGPVEASAIGNALVQARALGAVRGGLDDLRDLVRRTHPLRTYQPAPGAEDRWDEAERRLAASQADR